MKRLTETLGAWLSRTRGIPGLALVLLLLCSTGLAAQEAGVDEVEPQITSSGGEIQQGEFGEMFSTIGQPFAEDSLKFDSDGGESSWIGFWHVVPSDTAAGIYEEWNAGGLGDAAITSAAPNPFAGDITIYTRIDRPGQVRLVLFNMLGEEIIRLIDGEREAGTSRVNWDPVDLSPGVYLLQLEVGGTLYPTVTITYAP